MTVINSLLEKHFNVTFADGVTISRINGLFFLHDEDRKKTLKFMTPKELISYCGIFALCDSNLKEINK